MTRFDIAVMLSTNNIKYHVLQINFTCTLVNKTTFIASFSIFHNDCQHKPKLITITE